MTRWFAFIACVLTACTIEPTMDIPPAWEDLANAAAVLAANGVGSSTVEVECVCDCPSVEPIDPILLDTRVDFDGDCAQGQIWIWDRPDHAWVAYIDACRDYTEWCEASIDDLTLTCGLVEQTWIETVAR